MSNVTQFPSENHRTDWIENFISTYNRLNKKTLSLLPFLYHDRIHYVSPLTEIQGLPELLRYSEGAIELVLDCEFKVTDKLVREDRAALYWTLDFRHRSIDQGKPLRIDGHSLLQQEDGLITYHRDYFDSSQLIYEHIPLIGAAIRWIKTRKR